MVQSAPKSFDILKFTKTHTKGGSCTSIWVLWENLGCLDIVDILDGDPPISACVVFSFQPSLPLAYLPQVLPEAS